jgi:exopolyphosphatase/guanosine-5'-triphosphate,3'-diphosphate pyrophosphatase
MARNSDIELPEPNQTYAAVDLGSNSFHLVVARREHGELRFIDRIREMVRLGGGLDAGGYLDLDVQKRAVDCLARFGQRLRGIPDANIRAVGTQTLRRMRNANSFLMIAETALGCPVDVIAGREEARLIYLGVSQGVAGHEERRLVIDIGGGSTELVIGEGPDPLELESLQFGCVSATNWYFGNGKLSRRRFDEAQRAVMAEMQELQVRYRRRGWTTAIGSSGTIRAAASICTQRGYCEEQITRGALARLKEDVLAFDRVEDVHLPGLSERRHAVFAGGLVVLTACFEALDLEELKISPFALREGVLHDLLGRLEHRDPRDKTVRAFRARYSVNDEQATRVQTVAMEAFQQISGNDLDAEVHGELLGWAADLHEVGLSVSHSQYQRHSGYLIEESDMAGFSQQEQTFLANLVRHHRRAIPRRYAGTLPARLHEPLRLLLFCLRLACVLCRTRDDAALPEFDLDRDGHRIILEVSAAWATTHPLTIADLESERAQLRVMGLFLDVRLGSRDK